MTIHDLAARFPADFRFGTATSSYQIEGAVDADGRGRSIWDTFSHTPGRVLGGDTGDVAVDHYRRMEQDVALMADLGMRSYRFSVAWPRIVPDGHGEIEPRGLAFYRRMVDTLRQAEIEPVVTLYHWDLPQALQDRGGWVNRETVAAFVRYAGIVHEELGDAVSLWTTLNEPWCAAFLGYGSGHHAPGITDPRSAYRAAHHLLLAHGDAVARMRAGGEESHRFGLVPNLYGIVPASDDPADLDAADTIDALQNRLWLDATLLGRYPEKVTALMERFGAADAVQPEDLARISEPLDMLGINYYSQHHIAAGPPEPGYDSAYPGADEAQWRRPDLPTTAMGWSIEPGGLRDVLLRVGREWPSPPLMVCENGAAFPDDTVDDGARVTDEDRRQFLQSHITAVAEAIEAGADVIGYTAWSLLDNFEWAFGYDRRFGIVHVDYATQQRTPKASARWYRDLITAHTSGPARGER